MKLFTKAAFTCLLLVSLTRISSAQTVNSGAWMVGGNVGFNSVKTDGADASETWFNLTPNLGYYILNDLAVGVRLNFQSYSFDGASESQFGIGPWARYYFVNSLYAQAGIDFGSTGMDFFSLLADEGSTTLNFGIGYSWFLNNSVAIEPSIQYSIYSGDADSFLSDYTRFGFNIGIQAFIGRD